MALGGKQTNVLGGELPAHPSNVSPRDLRYCLDVLQPEARRLEAEQWDCIGIPWRFFRWRRAYKAHAAINEQWKRILAGQEVAP